MSANSGARSGEGAAAGFHGLRFELTDSPIDGGKLQSGWH
jgi:hypothetical protein